MLPSWLSPGGSDEQQNAAVHAVLGTPLRAPLMDDQEEAVFACGCFWGAEKGFWRLPGVVTTAVGYAGGTVDNPSYNQVCSGRTGHTEVVRVVWSTPAIDFSDLLKLFWECHDPTQGNRQGNDTGSQYRSAVYTTTEQQLLLTNASREAYQIELNQRGFGSITTEILANQTFFSLLRITTSNISPNLAAAPTAQPCQPKRCWAVFQVRPTNCRTRCGTTTTGAFSTAFFAATTAQFRSIDRTHAKSIVRSSNFGCHCTHLGCGDWFGSTDCEARTRARAWFALARPTRPTDKVVGHLNQSGGKLMQRCQRGMTRAPRTTQ